METIDNAYDFTAYRLGPIKVEGDVTFPVPLANDYFSKIVQVGCRRDNTTGGLLTKNIKISAFYDNSIGYEYNDCSVNTFSVNVTSEEALEFTMNVIGTGRKPISGGMGAGIKISNPSPERVLTWDGIGITAGSFASGGASTWDVATMGAVQGGQVKTFSFEVNNNTTGFFGLNKKIFIQKENIIAGKREVTGSMEVAWNGSKLENVAYKANTQDDGNKIYCGTDQYIQMEVATGCGTPESSFLKFVGVIFNMEDISMSNDFFMGTQTWKAYGAKTNGYRSMILTSPSFTGPI